MRSGPRTVRAGGILYEAWRCYSLAPTSVDSLRRTIDNARSFRTTRASVPDSPRLARLDEPFPEANPPLTSSVVHKHHPPAPFREDSSPRAPLPVTRFHLRTRTASGTPGEERTFERFRTPSVVCGKRRAHHALFNHLGASAKMPRDDCVPVRPRLCRRARQRDADLPQARCSRFRVNAAMRPTDFCQPLPASSAPALSASDLAIGGPVVSRRAGPASADRAVARRGFGPHA